MPLHNDSGVPQTIRHGDRVAQMVVLPYLAVDFLEADALDETERGEGGFGKYRGDDAPCLVPPRSINAEAHSRLPLRRCFR